MSFEEGLLVGAQDEDGKQIVTPYPASDGFRTWFCGASDQMEPLVRGGGARARLEWTSQESRGAKTLTLQWAEPVEVHDGSVLYTGSWDLDDTLDVSVLMPANAPTPSGSGNCNVVNNLIVPAAGDGGYQLDLATAVPVPADPKAPNGFWDMDYDSGVITPSANPGHALYHLLTVPMQPYVARRIPLGDPSGSWAIHAYKVQSVHPTWKMLVTVDKQSAGAGILAGMLLCFRRNLT